MNSLITAYTEEKERLGTALPLTCKSHATSLRIILAPILEKTVIGVTPAAAERLYAELIGTPNARTGRPVAIATHRFYLATARHMFGWAVKKGFITANPFGAVTPVGKPKAGKKQLRIEEARLFIETALKRYEKKRKPIPVSYTHLDVYKRQLFVLVRFEIVAGGQHERRWNCRMESVISCHSAALLSSLS